MLKYRGATPVVFKEAGRMRWMEVYDITEDDVTQIKVVEGLSSECTPRNPVREVATSVRIVLNACLSTTDVDSIHKALRDLDAQLKEIAP